MKARGEFVIIRKIKEEVKSKNGLIVSEAHDLKIRYKLAEVVSIGPDVENLNVGEKVYYDSSAESEIRVNGEKLSAIHQRGIVIVI